MTLNQEAGTIDAENQSFDRYGLGLQAEGGAQSNFFGTPTGQVTASYISFTADAAAFLRTTRTRYYVLYEPQYSVYPQYSDINHFSQRAFFHLTHAFSEHLGMEWDTTAARYLSLNQFLPQTLGIGGIVVVVPSVLASELLQNSSQATNAATSISVRYLINTRMTFSGSVTGAYFLSVPKDPTKANGQGHVDSRIGTQRFITSGGDFQLNYQLTPRDTIGADFTPVYFYGFLPKGQDSAETLQFIYQRQLNPTLSVHAGAGPLFVQASSPKTGSVHDISYAINGGLSRQLRQSQFSLNYSRAFIVSFLTTQMVAHQVGFSAYIPFGKNWLSTSSANYAHQAGSNTYGNGTIYGGTTQIAYLFGPKLQLYASFSRISQNLSLGNPQNYAFTQNKFGAGIRFNLGRPTRGGVQ